MVQVKYKNKVYEAELVDNWWKISKGLSFTFRKRPMWFAMPYEAKWSFWMFGMLFPLKIIFMDENREVVDEFDAKPMSLDPQSWKTYVPSRPAKYVLEIPA